MSGCVFSRIAAGDRSAVEECLARFGGLVWALARRSSTDSSDAEDAVQEIFVDLWKNAGRFDQSRGSEVTFVALLARRRLIDRQRKQRRTVPTQPLAAEEQERGVEPAFTAAFNDEIARAREELERLKPQERQVIEMAVDRGMTTSEIAAALDMPQGTVKTHSRRGLQRLRELFGQRVPQPVSGEPRS